MGEKDIAAPASRKLQSCGQQTGLQALAYCDDNSRLLWRASSMYNIQPSQPSNEGGTIIIPILQLRKGRLTDVAEPGLEDFVPSQSLPS